jgi:alanine-glyoxylate transaminase/(R)-3-amino-2-methylpropionate-pyruvate transaminase
VTTIPANPTEAAPVIGSATATAPAAPGNARPTARKAMPRCDYTPRPYAGPSRDEVLAMRKQFVNPAVFTLYKEPLMIVEGHMQWLFDETGRRYLDFYAGIVTVACGHCHPKVVKAAQDQLGTLPHATTIYLHPNLAKLAKKLASKMPPGLDVTYFVNSGSEANDLAISMARLYTGNRDVIAVRTAYHGNSPSARGLTSLSTWKFSDATGSDVHHAINPHFYRNPFSGAPDAVSSKAANDIRDLIRFSTPGKVAAFICEPIQGAGGLTHGAKNYLKEAYAIVREAGGLAIADEVQTGFGRTGDQYWGFQNFDVVPDFVTMAKGLGNGAPIAAVTTRSEIAQALTQRIHFNTFGGNPVSTATALAVLDVIDEDGLQQNAKERGAQIRAGLDRLQSAHKVIGDVRGMGLMVGVELVRDRTSKEPAKQETADVLEAAREMGLLIGKGGIDGNVLRVQPPMCITSEDAEFALDVFDRAFAAVTK